MDHLAQSLLQLLQLLASLAFTHFSHRWNKPYYKYWHLLENVEHSALHTLPASLSLPVPGNTWSHYICIVIICTTSNNQIPYNASPLFNSFLNIETSPPQCLKLVFLFMKTHSTNHNVPVFSKFTSPQRKLFSPTLILVLTEVHVCSHLYLFFFLGGGDMLRLLILQCFCRFCQIEGVLFLTHLLSYSQLHTYVP